MACEQASNSMAVVMPEVFSALAGVITGRKCSASAVNPLELGAAAVAPISVLVAKDKGGTGGLGNDGLGVGLGR